jgi:hypothetical protein
MTAPLTLAELNERRKERAQLEADMGRLRKRLAVLTREILSGVALPAPGVADGQLALPAEDQADMEAAADAGVAKAVAEHREAKAPGKPDLSADVRPPACGWDEAIDLTIRLLVERGEEGTRAGEVETATTRRSSTEAPRVVLDAYCAARVLALLDSSDVAAACDDGLSAYTPSIHLDGKSERARIASAHELLADYLTGLVEDSEPQTAGELARALEVPPGLVTAALERIPRGVVWRDTDGRWKPKAKPAKRGRSKAS